MKGTWCVLSRRFNILGDMQRVCRTSSVRRWYQSGLSTPHAPGCVTHHAHRHMAVATTRMPRDRSHHMLGTSQMQTRLHSSHADAESPHFSDDPETSSLDAEEVNKFNFANNWWSQNGEARALHTLNELRVPFISEGLASHGPHKSPVPLTGLKILDVGCGGGILSEALGRLGASVTGLDALQENIAIATAHCSHDTVLASRVSYLCSTVEDHLANQPDLYDAVVCSEVIEHVNDPAGFVTTCCSLIKPGGSIFFTTMSRTPFSYLLAVLAAENIFQVVKKGSHDWNKFVSPSELQDMLQQNGLEMRMIHGMTLNPLSLKWCWIKDTSINYALHAVKPQH